ncbi:FCGBP protein, partial [Nyctibius bracteatus]|nr:FCGBP protein [Nyctibius bracteatus]
EVCEVVDGQPTCFQGTVSTCWATGEPHYKTFDGKTFDFMGTCTYTLTKTCDLDPTLPVFSVEAKNEHRGNPKVSYVGSVTVRVYDVTVAVVRAEDGIVRVDSISHHLPAILSKGRVQVHQHGMGVLLQTDFGLVVRYDLLHHVTVTVPQSYQGHLCGLCGNYNGQHNDDFLLPNGQQAPNAVAFSSA